MLRVVQVGYGYWGANIARKLTASSRFDFKALCEILPDRIAKARRELPESVRVWEHYEDYLENPEIDAFVIATQTENTYEIGMKAMAAGKHVFMEKPLATTVERALSLRERAFSTGMILHCDHIMLYNPYYRYIKKLYDAGELGDLIYFDVEKLNLGPIRMDVNALMDLAVHDVAVLDWFSDGQMPEQLSAFGAKPFGQQETLTYLTMKYSSFLAQLKSSWVSPLKVRQTVVAGTRKMVIFDDMSLNEKVRIYDCGIDVIPAKEYMDYAFLTRRGDIHIPYIEFEDSLQNSLEYFENCVQKGRQSRSGPDEALRVMKVLERAQKAMVS